MLYVFDTCAFRVLFNHYYPSRFPTLWERFDYLVENQEIVSVREVANEIDSYYAKDALSNWARKHPEVFYKPNYDELRCVSNIFSNEHFSSLVSKSNLLQGKPVADPFIIAKAKVSEGVVITQEKYKENAAKIPNVCKELAVPCTNLEGFMERENWRF